MADSQAGRPILDSLAEFPVVIAIPVQWGEMDAFGHVNNTVYFRYFESARIAYLERIGFRDPDPADPRGAILHSTHARFRQPLVYPETVRVGARATELRDDRFTMEYRVVTVSEGGVAAEGSAVVVSYHYGERRKVSLPEAVLKAITALEASAPARRGYS